MDFEKLVFERRSVRRFSEKPVSDEDLSFILDAGMYAPSGVNLQPWYFVAVKSPEAMKRLLSFMDECAEKNTPHLTDRFKANPDVAKSSIGFIRDLGHAPVCLLAFRGKDEYPLTDEGVVQSIAAAMENMLLAAWNRGIASCWMTAPLQAGLEERLRDEFAPGKGRLVAIAPLGYAADGAVPKPVPRKPGRFTVI